MAPQRSTSASFLIVLKRAVDLPVSRFATVARDCGSLMQMQHACLHLARLLNLELAS
ncbi:MAG TPA: hypothetical protein VE735_08215 [Gammaproteobacteria bacterium]|nr:hypothetical protein [Gammaproteobacteria bacterium]